MSGPPWRSPVRMAEAVARTLQSLGLEAGVRQRGIWRVWETVVGPQIARHAQPRSIARGRLVVHVSDPVWLHQLSMMRHRLLTALREASGEAGIREIVLRIGEVDAPPPVEMPPPSSEGSLDPFRRAEIQALVGILGDAPCRDALERLMVRASRTGKPEDS